MRFRVIVIFRWTDRLLNEVTKIRENSACIDRDAGVLLEVGLDGRCMLRRDIHGYHDITWCTKESPTRLLF